jgi:surface protein
MSQHHGRFARLLLFLTLCLGCADLEGLLAGIGKPPPQTRVTTLAPAEGPVGTRVTLTGHFMSVAADRLEIAFCGTPLEDVEFSDLETSEAEVIGDPPFAFDRTSPAYKTVTATVPRTLAPGPCPITATRLVSSGCIDLFQEGQCVPGPVKDFYNGVFTVTGPRLGPPTELSAFVSSTGTLTVSFTPPPGRAGPITKYWSQVDEGQWVEQPVADSPVPLPGVDPKVTHSIVLAAADEQGRGEPSEVYTWTPPPARVPDAPTQLVATPGEGQATVEFMPPFDGGSPITAYEASVNDGAWTALPQATPGSPVTVTGLTNDVTASIRLRAVNAVGPGAPSAPVDVTPTAPRVPDAPTNLRPRPMDGGAVIAFNIPFDGGSPILRYEYSVGSGPWGSVVQATPASPVTITGLQNGTQVGVSLRAVNAVGAGAASTVVFVTPRPVREPDAPTSLVATPRSGAASVAFTVPYDGGLPITSYESSVDNGAWTTITQATPGTPVTVSGLTDGVAVSIRLRAVNDVGPGAPSLPVFVTPLPPRVPDAPLRLSAAPGQGQATLTFTAPYDGGSAILRYEVRIGSGGAFAPANQPAPGSPITVTGLTNGVAVDLSVRAVNAVGAGAEATVSVTPVLPTPMVLVVDTDSGGAGSKVALPLRGAVDVTIDWGGSTANAPAGECPTSLVSANQATATQCTYDAPGQYTVQVNGTVDWFGAPNGYLLAQKITKITAWGALNLKSLAGAFYNPSYNPTLPVPRGIQEVPAELPPTVTDLSYAFALTPSFQQSLDTWDTSHVVLMKGVFFRSKFNASVADWDTRAVTDMSELFFLNDVFNQPLDAHGVTRFGRTYTAWDVRNVATFQNSFASASAFNQTLEHWDTSAATDISYMFSMATAFNQPLNTHEVTVGGRTYLAWDVSNVTTLSNTFGSASAFNQPLDAWNTSKVISLAFTFLFTPFNQPIDTHEVTVGGQTYVAWNTGNVASMVRTFQEAAAFNQPLGNWDTRKVVDMEQMFSGARAFNQDLAPSTVNVGPLSYVSWDTSKVTSLWGTFLQAQAFNGDIRLWDTSSVVYLNATFRGARAFNQDLSGWNTSNVTEMFATFAETNVFNQPLGAWNTSKVTTMKQMFSFARAFNQPLTSWNTSQVSSMQRMFESADTFNQDLSSWCVALIAPASVGNLDFDKGTTAWTKTGRLPNWGAVCTP